MTRLRGHTLALASAMALLTLAVGCEDEKPAKPKLQAAIR